MMRCQSGLQVRANWLNSFFEWGLQPSIVGRDDELKGAGLDVSSGEEEQLRRESSKSVRNQRKIKWGRTIII